MICKGCGEWKPIENKDTGLCATCNKDARDNRDLYPVVRVMFLEAMVRVGEKCPITGEDITMDSQIHHKMGRRGYASEEKRMQGISLLIDVDHFLAVSPLGHQTIEAMPLEVAESLGYKERRSV